MFKYQVTEYNPKFCDSAGKYLRDDWTLANDIGQCFGDGVLTREQSQAVEDAHVAAVLGFLQEGGCESISVFHVDNPRGSLSAPAAGAVVTGPGLAEVVRRVLREEFWCVLVSGGCFVYFGYDYLYIVIPTACPEACSSSTRSGLFVEEYHSP